VLVALPAAAALLAALAVAREERPGELCPQAQQAAHQLPLLEQERMDAFAEGGRAGHFLQYKSKKIL
jgi:hypothetical protein